MTWWPWVTREHHAEVTAGKDAMIRSLEAQNAVLAERLAESIAVTVKPADEPAPVRRPRPPQAPPTPINWDSLDENDPVVIAKIAAQELGGNTSPFLLARKVASIKSQIRAARHKKMADSAAAGRVGTIAAPGTEEEAQAQGPEYVPSFIRQIIAEAERA